MMATPGWLYKARLLHKYGYIRMASRGWIHEDRYTRMATRGSIHEDGYTRIVTQLRMAT
jgi:hypothetical protein